ncbi:hypothetical protein, partial [Microbulbifer elongatus]|uniref:hypothetical protein n=1 Tax=Microbulbifer elongatus TaxID=86173 RepID=UPI001F4B7590
GFLIWKPDFPGPHLRLQCLSEQHYRSAGLFYLPVSVARQKPLAAAMLAANSHRRILWVPSKLRPARHPDYLQ